MCDNICDKCTDGELVSVLCSSGNWFCLDRGPSQFFFFPAGCSKPFPWISRCFYVTTSAAEVLSDVVLSQSCPPGRTTRAVSTLKLVWYLKHDRLTTKQHAGTQLYFQLLDSHLEIQKIRNKKLTENNGFTLYTNNELSLHGCIAAFWMQCCQMLDPRFYLNDTVH